jgi:murein tripeptide amidase MpaA
MPKISSDFDHGNIHCVDASDPANIQLEIVPDGKADFFQWFYFRVDGAASQTLVMTVNNVHKSSYPRGWENYRAVASYDRETWFRVDTSYDGKALKITHEPTEDTIYYAYFAAYPTTRFRAFVEEMSAAPLLTHSVIGKTLDGQDIDYFRAGAGALTYWVIARQHPGETMGSWWMEGFLKRLADSDDTAATLIREKATIYVVPCMNLDGAKRGHLRTNAAGMDLNRAWRNATLEKSPEVYCVREKMRETGVDLFLDVHGDENLPENFLDSAKGIPAWNEHHEQRFNRYSDLLLEASPDFQTKVGYPTAAPGKANLNVANNYVSQTWDCLGMTLEMPFKDANVNPDPVHGWSPERCRQLGRDNLSAMAQIVDELR